MKAKKDFVLDNISTEAIRVALEERVVQLLPNRDSHGRRIIFLEMGGKFRFLYVISSGNCINFLLQENGTVQKFHTRSLFGLPMPS